jgi:hypothetical protein
MRREPVIAPGPLPETRSDLQGWVREHLHLAPDVETALLAAIDAVFTRHERLWQESKQECYRWLERQRVHMTGLWFRSLWEEEHASAGSDPYVWGFKKSRAEVDKMLEYAQRQGLVTRRFWPEEMFHSSTLET